ncbi:unnamed protein product [Symbiodinium microadriaticum]|nr:unnamed protein product [Symbiodinium microadriaticum]
MSGHYALFLVFIVILGAGGTEENERTLLASQSEAPAYSQPHSVEAVRIGRQTVTWGSGQGHSSIGVMAKHWVCDCGVTNKLSAAFCPACGKHWQAQTGYVYGSRAPGTWQTDASQQPWTEDAWNKPRRPKSPRKRGDKGKGKGGKQGRAESPGRPKAGPPTPKAAQLPKPPPRAPIAGPQPATKEATSVASSSSTAEKAALERLLGAMRENEAELSPQLRELLALHQHDDAKEEAKTMHRIVASKAAAKKELHKLRASRGNYVKSWCGYLDQVLTTVQAQLEEHVQTMSDYATKEAQWEQSLQEATSALAKLASDETHTISDEDDEQVMETSETKVDEAIAAEANAQQTAAQVGSKGAELLQAIAQVRAQAAEDLAKEQSRERTPRRKGSAGPSETPPPGKAELSFEALGVTFTPAADFRMLAAAADVPAGPPSPAKDKDDLTLDGVANFHPRAGCPADIGPCHDFEQPQLSFKDGDPPSLLKRRLTGESPKPSEPRWHLQPPVLRESRYSEVVVSYTSWGKPAEDTRHLFTVFDTQRHSSAIPSHDASKIADYAQRAVDSAPGPVRAIQFLTVPVPGFPLPQVALTLEADPIDSMAIPWDCQAAGLPLRTVPHLRGESLHVAAEALQSTLPTEVDLAARIHDGRLLVLDVAGLLQDSLPVDLTEIQWLWLEQPIWGNSLVESSQRLPAMLEALRLGLPAGLRPVSTTSTTTAMLTSNARIFRIRLFGAGKDVFHDVQAPCQLDLVLCLLLGKLQHAFPDSCGPVNIMMAKAQPPPAGEVQEVLFCSHPADAFDSVPVFIDGRPQGGTLILAELPRLTTTENAVPDSVRGNGCFALINGAPAHLAQRTVMPGDYVQLGCSGVFVPHSADTVIMDLIPSVDVYGYPFAAQRTSDDGTFLARIRERRRAAKVWQPLENVITIVGPAHGPVRLRIESLFVPTVAEVREALIPMRDFNSMHLAMAYTTAQIPGAALFVTVCPQSDLRTVLLPIPTHPAHHIVLMIPSLAEDLGYLPMDPQQRILWTYERWRHGQILAVFTLPATMARPVHRHVRPPRPLARETYSPAGRIVPRSGTSLVQLPNLQDMGQARCRKAARLWQVDENQPCIEGLPAEVHQRLHSVPILVGDEHEGLQTDRRDSDQDHTGHNCHLRRTECSDLQVEAQATRCIPTPLGRRKLTSMPTRAPLALQTLLPVTQNDAQAAALSFGLEPEALDYVFQPFDRGCLCPTRPPDAALHPVARAFLQGLPDSCQAAPLEALQLYVDGSYTGTGPKVHAGWSIVAIGRQEGTWCWVGHLSTSSCPSGDHTTLGVAVSSAFEAELAGLVFALAVCQAISCPAAVFYDCLSAGQIVSAEASATSPNALTEAALSIHHLLWLQNRLPAFRHIKSHEGHPLNELVDSVAKLSAKQTAQPVPAELYWASQEHALAWLWAAAGLHLSLPRPNEAGSVCDSAPIVGAPGLALSDVLPSARLPQKETAHFHIRAATYNAMTAASQIQKESFARQFQQAGLHAIGLQETRVAESGRKKVGAYHVFSSSALNGEGGCQVWLAANLQLGTSDSGPVFWEPSSFSILLAEPQIMLVLARACGCSFAFLVGHAPVNKASVHTKEQWWQALSSAVKRVPPRATLILCLDANARLAKEGQPHPDNAFFMRGFLTAHNLVSTSALDEQGEELDTWYSPAGFAACIDYVCLPREIAGAMASHKVLANFEGQVEHDHRPVQIELLMCRTGARAPSRPSLDANFLRTQAGQQALQDIYKRMPPVPWHTDVDTHLGLIKSFLQTELGRLCPSKAAKPRSPVISSASWELIKHRRELRRELYGRKILERQRFLRTIFDTWAGRRTHEPDYELERQYTAFLVLQVADLGRSIKISSRKDSALATQDVFAEARTQGPEALASLLRHVMKSGRRFKPPPLAPAIWDAERETFIDGDRALGDHFAKAERADLVAPEDVTTVPAQYTPQALEMASAVSVASLAHSFKQLAHRKSPGLTGLPAEAYSQAAVAAASCHAPLVLKIALRGQMPILWRGGEVAAIAKPQKSPHSVEGWRSILLMEAAAKGVGRALRPALLKGYRQLKHSGQGGSVPKEPLQWAMALIRGFARRLRSAGKTGGVLFLDGKQAFYATLRQALVGVEAGSTAEAIDALAERFFSDPQDKLDFVAAAVGPGLLQASGVPEIVRRIATASLQRTWYVHGKATKWTYETFSGTTPGAPLADLYFQFLMSLVFEQVHERIQEECIEPWCPKSFGHQTFRMLAPSWMDDWALPLVPHSADRLIPQAKTLVSIVDTALHSVGIEVNYAPGKTELVPILAGKGSKTTRQALFQDNDVFDVALASGVVHVRIVPSYEHLGSIVTWDAADRKDLQHRRHLARTLLKSMWRILSNKFLTERERADLLVSMPLARLRHAAGLWAFASMRDFAAYETAYMELLRRSFRAITGISARGRTDAEICQGLGILTARQTRNADLVRHASWLLTSEEAAMDQLWFQGGVWLQNLQEALAAVGRHLQIPTIGLAALRANPSVALSWVRRYTRACRQDQEISRKRLLPMWQGQQLAQDRGWIFVHIDRTQKDAAQAHVCSFCARSFATAAARQAHVRKVHKVFSKASRATFGTRCESCSKEYWTATRLREHFRTHPFCRQFAIQSDIAPANVCFRSEPKTWKPAITVPGPRPWWATQRPLPDADDHVSVVTSGWGLLQGVLKRGSGDDMHGFVLSALKVAVQYDLSMEDAPLALLTTRHGALLQSILFAAEHMQAGSSGKLVSAPWLVTVSQDRAIFVPLGGNMQVVLPSEWDCCRALL